MLSIVKYFLNSQPANKNKFQSEEGQSLVELAIATPLLIFLLLGLFEVGSAIRTYVVMVNVNREITRFAVRPGYLDFATLDDVATSYESVRDWVDTSLGGQLELDFDNGSGDATLIVSHIVVDTGLPCKDIITNPENCDCDAFLTDPNYAKNFTLDDLIIHPGLTGMEYQSYRFGPAETTTGAKTTRMDFNELVYGELVPQNNKFNCEILKKNGVPTANNAIVTELFYDQPQLFGFPLVSNPFTDPVPLYTHTTMRLTCAARSNGYDAGNLACGVDTYGPTCMAYPITFKQDIFDDPDNPSPNQQIDAYEGDSPGNFGWITWNPDSSNNNAGYVEDELTFPQMSLNDFTNVNDPNDHKLSIGDDVSTKPGVANSNGVDEQLQALVGREILVPVYDNNPGNGQNAYYHITHFARIRIDEICLPRNGNQCDGQNKKQIKATFLRYDDEICSANSAPVGTNDPPVAVDDISTTPKNTPIVINVLNNDSDPDDDPLTITDVTNVSNPFKGTAEITGGGTTITYTPKNNDTGTYKFTYTISDGNGGTDTATVTITVTAVGGANNPPVASNDTYTTDQDTPLSRGAANGVLSNDTDADSNPLTAILVSGPSHGAVTLNADGSFTYTPNGGYTGSDKFTYKANDGVADSNVATVNITVNAVNKAPVAKNDNYSTDKNTVLNVSADNGVLKNDTDADGDSLTASLVSGPSHGSVSLSVDGSFTYTPNNGYTGTDSFTYRANDGTANSNVATASITVNAVNQPPVAKADSYSTNEDTLLSVPAGSGVLANDTDTDGDSLTAVLVMAPPYGVLTFNANGSFSYSPKKGYSGTDNFTYKASDGKAYSDVVTVMITVVSTTPTMHVDRIDVTIESKWSKKDEKYYYRARYAEVYVVDANGSPVKGATVEGNWSGVVSGSDSDKTDGSGQTQFTSDWSASPGPFRFTVTNITNKGWTYNPSANVEDWDEGSY